MGKKELMDNITHIMCHRDYYENSITRVFNEDKFIEEYLPKVLDSIELDEKKMLKIISDITESYLGEKRVGLNAVLASELKTREKEIIK